MSNIPTLWRIELLHVAMVHLPIVLLPLATALFIVGTFTQRERFRSFLLQSSSLLLVIGVLGGWAAVYSGDMAENVVNRVICDPTMTAHHGELAIDAMWCFTGALALRLLQCLRVVREKLNEATKRLLFDWFAVITLVIGAVLLFRAAHLGATLVYTQGAGVYFPSTECVEFSN